MVGGTELTGRVAIDWTDPTEGNTAVSSADWTLTGTTSGTAVYLEGWTASSGGTRRFRTLLAEPNGIALQIGTQVTIYAGEHSLYVPTATGL
jgi:hypothetical protein